MTTLLGGDSAVPQPDHYGDARVWGLYVGGDTPHVWTRSDVTTLGTRAFLPIVVPPQRDADGVIERWWAEEGGVTGGYAILDALVREAMAWGCIAGGPLCLDLEEFQVEAMGSGTATYVVRAWLTACQTRKLSPWTYSGQVWHEWTAAVPHSRWLASWTAAAGTEGPQPTTLQPGYLAHQWAGDVEGGTIDLDLFAPGLTLYTLCGSDYHLAKIGG